MRFIFSCLIALLWLHRPNLEAGQFNLKELKGFLETFGKPSRFSEKLDEKSRSPWRFVSEALKLEASEINALGRLSVEKGLQMAAPQANVIEADFFGFKLGEANGDWSPEKSRLHDPVGVESSTFLP